MAVYTVHEPPLRADDAAADPDRFIFVRDGFYGWALLFGPLWILRHQLWLVLLLYIAVLAGVQGLLWWAGVPASVRFVVVILIAILVALEGATLRRWTLRRRGFHNVGVVVGDDLEEAERRFFARWVEETDAGRAGATPAATPASAGPRMPPARPDVIGLFPEPGAPR
jgi:Protein of unknown function (DUF2628)